jgi:chemotaxis methyl-accepting protein methylase
VAISVSGLFRDSEQFVRLEAEILPQLLAGTRRVTVWSAGCADGSELYSVGMLLERLGGLDRALLLGSDVLQENITTARTAQFADAPVSNPLRARTRWECRDVVRDGPPSGKWRLVLCRNLAIYLAPGAKEALYRTLAQALALDGFLMLGRSERIGNPRAHGLDLVGPHLYRKTPQWG